MKKNKKKIPGISLFLSITFFICINIISLYEKDIVYFVNSKFYKTTYQIENIPTYNKKPYIILENNKPNFTKSDYEKEEKYSNLDLLGRCGPAFAIVGIETIPVKKRESIGNIKPTGWHTIKYEYIDGKYLYNRCHLIGYQLTGENANPKNLITCTRSMNTEGMLPFENKVAQYVKETKNHVLYRVTPIFKENNLLASGVQIEAKSVEDQGKGISLNVFVYNVQDKVHINYKDGSSYLIK